MAAPLVALPVAGPRQANAMLPERGGTQHMGSRAIGASAALGQLPARCTWPPWPQAALVGVSAAAAACRQGRWPRHRGATGPPRGRGRWLAVQEVTAMAVAGPRGATSTIGQEISTMLESAYRVPLEQLVGRNLGGKQVQCPACRGGQRHDNAFSVKVENGFILYNCFRAKCGIQGRVPWPQSQGHAPAKPATDPQQHSWHAPLPLTTMERGMEPSSCHGKRVPLDLGSTLKWLVEERCIPMEVLRRNQVHQEKVRHPSGRMVDALVFPFYAKGVRVAAKYRALPKTFWQAPGGQHALYGVDDLQGQEEIIIVEGEIDKLSVEAAGLRHAASVQCGALGGLSLSFGAEQYMSSASKIILATDTDEGGDQCAANVARQLSWSKCYRVRWRHGCKDANEVLMKHGSAAVREDIQNSQPLPPPAGIQSLNDAREQLTRRIRGEVPDENIRGVSTGWDSVDRHYRIVPGELTVVTGKPGSGKSEWLISMLLNVAESSGWRFMIFEFEASARTINVQLLEKRLARPFKRIEESQLDGAFEWLDEHIRLGSSGYDSPMLEDVLALARAEVKSKGIRGIMIDPYNYLLRTGTDAERFETYFVSGLLSKLKRFATETGCHVWIVAHPAKSSAWASEKVTLYDIAGSANWFNKCDMGIVVHRQSVEFKDGEHILTNRIELCVEKVRNKEAGCLGTVELIFDGSSRSYAEDA